MPACALSLHEREEIRAGIERGDTDTQIAVLIGRHRGTINAEINRNGGRANYVAVDAQRRADAKRRRSRQTKLESDSSLFTHVEARLKAGDSPMTISIELARNIWGITRQICHETIYQAIYASLFDSIRTPHLKRRQRKPRNRTAPGGHSLGNFRPIHTRPAGATNRTRYGHLEGDLIVGAYNKSAVITLTERKTRNLWIGTVNSKKATDLTTGLTRLLNTIPEKFRLTLTWDQGAEIAEWQHIETSIGGLKIYITDPKAPWQRPTNENSNGHVRRYLPKGTDLSVHNQTHLNNIAHRLNTTPRRILNWDTPADRYAQQLSR